MKKGELKKQEILRTAETLFCKNGYETTSIQDILDVLHTSKGSFYHHYASKELLLEEICRQRATTLAEKAVSALKEEGDPVENLNLLFSGMMPLSGEKLSFLVMILPVFDLPEGRQIRFSYSESITAFFRDMMIHEIQRGNSRDEIYCPAAEHSAEMISLILNELWYQICLQIIRKEKENAETDLSELLNMIVSYRGTIERLLNAPVGSIRLLDLDDLKFLTERIHYHWKLQKYSE